MGWDRGNFQFLDNYLLSKIYASSIKHEINCQIKEEIIYPPREVSSRVTDEIDPNCVDRFEMMQSVAVSMCAVCVYSYRFCSTRLTRNCSHLRRKCRKRGRDHAPKT